MDCLLDGGKPILHARFLSFAEISWNHQFFTERRERFGEEMLFTALTRTCTNSCPRVGLLTKEKAAGNEKRKL
jgi:hypothetical protein